MEILGVGPAEMLVILVIALIVFGPGRLPEIGVALGRAIGDLRRASRELTADLQSSVAEATGDVEEALSSTQADLRQTSTAVRQETRALAGEISAPAPAAPPAKKEQQAPADDPDTRWLRLGSALEEEGAEAR